MVSENYQRRSPVLMAILITLALLLVGQLWRWQLLNHDRFVQRARSVQGQLVQIEPQRGMILDRNGHILAISSFNYQVAVAPRWVKKSMVADIAAKLAPMLPQSEEELREMLASNASYISLAKNLPLDKAEALEALGLNFIQISPYAYRFYPEGPLAGHLLGFMNATGQGFGLEKYYDGLLRGQPGLRRVAWDPTELPHEILPRDGAHLYLALDYMLQYQVEQELAQGVEEAQAEGGTVIVMDPRTGAVLAWASYPGYDPNHFAELAATGFDRFIDPAISKQYEPGSVVKILTMAAALDSGLVTPQSTMQDRKSIEVGGRIIQNWDRKNHGLVSMVDVLALSLNVCAAQLSTQMGSQTFYSYLNAFGLGQKTGIDLSGEIPGRVKQPGDVDWSESELGMNSFGQGMAITPIQLITAVAAVANGGQLMRPYVVQGWVQGNEWKLTKPRVVRRVISPETARQLTDMLAEAVQREAPLALVPGYRVAGKTGTAQIPIPGGYHPKDTIASFVGYLPTGAPRVIILVKIDRPKSSPWGNKVAAPVFSRIARRACHLLGIPPEGALLAHK